MRCERVTEGQALGMNDKGIVAVSRSVLLLAGWMRDARCRLTGKQRKHKQSLDGNRKLK